MGWLGYGSRLGLVRMQFQQVETKLGPISNTDHEILDVNRNLNKKLE